MEKTVRKQMGQVIAFPRDRDRVRRLKFENFIIPKRKVKNLLPDNKEAIDIIIKLNELGCEPTDEKMDALRDSLRVCSQGKGRITNRKPKKQSE